MTAATGMGAAATGPELPLVLRLVRVRLPLKRAHATAHGTETHRDSILVSWTRADGVEGWGECPTLSAPGYATETTDRAWAGLVAQLAPAALAGRLAMAPGLVAASSALADAELDARLRAGGRSLSDHLGATRSAVPRCAVLASVGDEPDAVAAVAVAELDGGAAMVKVKVTPSTAVPVLTAVRHAVGDATIAADANGSFVDAEAVMAVADVLSGVGIVFLEQPLPAGTTWDEMAALRRALPVPVALDESLVSADAVRTAVLAGAADVVSVKPARLGGVERAALAVDWCREQGVDAFVGGMFELGVGRAAAVAVAALDGCTMPTDLGPSDRYVDDDVTAPVVLDDAGRLVVPAGAGSGRVPDPDRLAAASVDDVVLSR